MASRTDNQLAKFSFGFLVVVVVVGAAVKFWYVSVPLAVVGVIFLIRAIVKRHHRRV